MAPRSIPILRYYSPIEGIVDEQLATLIDDYITATNRREPGAATSRGFHEHDAALADRSAAAIEARQGEIKALLARIENVDRSGVEGYEPYDATLLERRLRWEDRRTRRGARLAAVSVFLPRRDRVVLQQPGHPRLRAARRTTSSLVSRLRRSTPARPGAHNLVDPSTYAVENAIESGTV
jgi:uncharacterized protein (DUF885 family)